MCDAIDTEGGGDVAGGSEVAERGSATEDTEGGMDTSGAAEGDDKGAGETPMFNPRADIPVVTANSAGDDVAPVSQGELVDDLDDAVVSAGKGGGIGDAAPQP